ncbi:MAG: hypothetical protein FWF59_14770 [Turicibacter sp.]|nr:hypothetical protein [Turicibacter sp.]
MIIGKPEKVLNGAFSGFPNIVKRTIANKIGKKFFNWYKSAPPHNITYALRDNQFLLRAFAVFIRKKSWKVERGDVRWTIK